MNIRRLIIVGGGFAGVTLAQRLERRAAANVEIVLISSENHMVFSPLLAEAVGRSISPLHVVVAGRQMLRRALWLTSRVTEIDLKNNLLHHASLSGERGSFSYDHLILACGSVVNLDLLPGLAAYAYPLKTLGDAVFLGNDLIARLEEAAVVSDQAERRRLLTVVVIGGGFSGVEVAGELAEMMERVRRYYPALRDEPSRIILLQKGDRLLPELNAPSLADFARDKLRASGVDIRLNSAAQEVTARGVRLKSGEQIDLATVVSTVGTTTNPLITALGLPLQRGRLPTEPDMRIKDTENVWALGDCAVIPNAYDANPSPPTAQFATRQAKQLADNLLCVLEGKPTKPFSFKPLGILASLGHRNAVAEVFGLHLSGVLAWMMWRGIYLGKLPSLSRKLEVLVDWTWKIFFPPNIVQLQMSRTEGVGQAHYGAGEFVFRKGDPVDRFLVVKSGTAGIYIDEGLPAIAVLRPGDFIGGGELLSQDGTDFQRFTIMAEEPLDLITLRRDAFARLSESMSVLRQAVQRSQTAVKGYAGFMALMKDVPRLAAIKVADVMSSPAETLAPELSLAEAVRQFHGGRPGYPVTDVDAHLQGYCGRAELYEAMRGASLETRVRDFMRKDPPTVAENQSLPEVIVILLREQIEIFPVVASDGSGKVVGVLSPVDLFQKTLSLRSEGSSLVA